MSAGIVVGYDGSQGAKEAVRVAIEVGKAYGERVVIAFAYELNPVAGELHDYHAALKELATTRLTEAVALASDAGAGTDIEAVIVEQAPALGLVDLAEERDARVIVVGTRGESPLRGALLGSTPHKLLQLSDRPVLVVPSRE
ncbi:MAG TPA: universal stress protein [Solirubrobacteraceae bacterium]|jgi:nucleotide-binding universal stress UspA family protein|nr:universal stress protein [Solirubrobacteraceae bacterium]